MHVLGRKQRSGVESRYWPIINRKFVGNTIHPTWWLDATSEPIRRGRQPEGPEHARCTGFEGLVHDWCPGFCCAKPVHRACTGLKETRAPLRITRAPASGLPIENKGNAGLEFTKEFQKRRNRGRSRARRPVGSGCI